MKKIRKQVLSFVLTLVMLVGAVPFVTVETSAATTKMSLEQLKAKFPQDKYWNHKTNSYHNNEGYAGMCTDEKCTDPDGWTTSPCTSHSSSVTGSGKYDCNYYNGATQCHGFALKLAKDAYGENARNWDRVYNLNTVKPGDIIRYSEHTVFVTAVKGETVYFGECNYTGRCKINWKRSLKKTSFSNLSYVCVAPYELTATTTNILTMKYSANGGTIAESNIYKTTDALNLRSSASTSATVLDTMPSGTTITVTATKVSGDYTWGKTTYDGQTGWCALEYTKRQGYYVNSGLIYHHTSSSTVTSNWAYGTGHENGLWNTTSFGLTREGYKFVGWCKNADGSGTIFDQNDATLKAETIEPTVSSGSKTITLYAIWEKQTGCQIGDHTDADGAWEHNATQHYHTCSCGVQFDFADHNATLVDVLSPTCTLDGYTGDMLCNNCESILSYGEAIPATKHTTGDWVVITPATETTEGVQVKSCVVCDEELEREAIPVLAPVPSIPGDVNNDGVHKVDDALMVLQSIIGKVELTATQMAVADVTGDNAVNVEDALQILQFLTGRIEAL